MIRACALLLLIAGAICRAQAPPPAAADPSGEDRRILVMLRIPPAHFRPDGGYGGGYDAQSGRTARHRIAAAVAAAHGLVVESDWPMPSLGVDCFLMKAAPDQPLHAVLDALASDSRTAWAQPLNKFHSLSHNDPLCRAAISLCEALHYCHCLRDAGGRPSGMVHQGLSPRSVMIATNGAVKK